MAWDWYWQCLKNRLMEVEVWIFIGFSIVIAVTALVLLVYYQRQLDSKDKLLQEQQHELDKMRLKLQRYKAGLRSKIWISNVFALKIINLPELSREVFCQKIFGKFKAMLMIGYYKLVEKLYFYIIFWKNVKRYLEKVPFFSILKEINKNDEKYWRNLSIMV